MENDLNILKVEYLSNHRSDYPQISKLDTGDQIKIENVWKEDDLQWMTLKYQILNILATTDRNFLKFQT